MFITYTAFLDSTAKEALTPLLPPEGTVNAIETTDSFGEFAEKEPGEPCNVVFCGGENSEIEANELGQTFRMIFPNTKIFYLSSKSEKFKREEMIKNGFDDAFLLPLDTDEVKSAIEVIRSTTNEKTQSYRSVKLFDLSPGEKLDFDIYLHLPANNKYIKYVGAGGEISDDQYGRLKNNQVNSAHVQLDELPKFYNYSAKRLKALTGQEGALSETERQEKVKTAVRGIFLRIFDDSNASMGEGKALVDDAKGIIDQYVKDSPFKELYEKITSQISDSKTNYSHTLNVSIYASLFSIATGLGKPEELSIAGLLHDLGELSIPDAIKQKRYQDMSFEEKSIYEAQIDDTIKIIRERKIVIPQSAFKAIEQHQERFDGSGFPKGIKGKVMCVEAQILGLADEFDNLTLAKSGRKSMLPHEVIEMFSEAKKFSPEVLEPLKEIFPKPE